MHKAFSKLQGPAYTLLRFMSGFMFTFHGMQKIFGAFGGVQGHGAVHFSDAKQMWVGGLIELVTGVLVAAGLFTRYAAFLASGTMAVAYFQFHVGSNFANFHWLPVVNMGELAVLYTFVFLAIAAYGPGRASLDRAFKLDQ